MIRTILLAVATLATLAGTASADPCHYSCRPKPYVPKPSGQPYVPRPSSELIGTKIIVVASDMGSGHFG